MAAPKSKGVSKTAVYVWDDTNKEFVAWDGVLNAGEIEIGRVQIEGLGGASTDGTVALASANTWYQVPDSVPSDDYTMVVSKENEGGTIRWSFTNGGTPSATNGNQMWSDEITVNLAGNEVLYFGSSNAGDDVNWTAKIND